MRINFFSILLVMLCTVSFGKVLSLIDRIMINAANVDTKVTTMFMVESAIASDNNSIPANAPTDQTAPAAASPTTPAADPNTAIDKTVSEAKPEKSKIVEGDSKDHVTASGKPASKKGYEGMENLLDIGLNGDEIKLLKELAKRRDSLDRYQQQLTMKESLLKATEAKLDQKMQDMNGLQERINDLLKQLDVKSSLRIKSLAKIYENMKPGEAAKIFDELEMPILLDIIRNMKEQKVAPIIAQMNPVKAKDVSLDFAKVNELQNTPQ